MSERLVPLLIATVTFISFIPALRGQFVNWDDWANITENEHFRGLGPAQLKWMFTTGHMGHYQPLSWMSLAVDWLIYGEERPWGFHLTNVLLHAASAVVFYLVAVRLLRAAMGEANEREAGRSVRIGAAAAALLFAVHPLRVESVAWVTERRDVLSSLFYLLTILTYLRYCAAGVRRRAWFALSLALFVCALLAKVMSVSLPVILLVLDWYPLRRIGWGTPIWSAAGRRVLAEKAVFVALSLAPMAVAVIAQRGVNSMIPLRLHGIPDRLAVCAYGLGFYLRKTVWPAGLSPLYELPAPVHPLELRYLVAAVVAAAITVAAIALRRRFPALLSAWACYVVILFPVLGLLQNGPQIAADRYSYLSCLGPILLLGAAVAGGWRRAAGSGGRGAIGIACGGVVCVLAVMTWRQCGVWRDSLALWTRAVSIEPDCGFCNGNLGKSLDDVGREDEAIAALRHAIEVRPRIDTAQYCLAGLLRRRGEIEAAVHHYREVLKIDPNHEEATTDLATTLYGRGEVEEAIRLFRRAIELAPKRAITYRNLAGLLAERGQFEEAESLARKATELAPGNAEGHYNLAGVLFKVGRLDEAVAEYRRAIELNPAYVEAYINLTVLLRQAGRVREAIELLQAGVQAAPNAGRLQQMLAALEREAAGRASGG